MIEEILIGLGIVMVGGAVTAGHKYLKKKVEETPAEWDDALLRAARKFYEKRYGSK